MSCRTCAQRPGCKNRKLVVVDTSVVIWVLRFLCDQYRTQSRREPAVGSFDDLCFGLEYFLQGLRCCASDDSLYVSRAVVDNELSMHDPSCAIRTRVDFPPRMMGAVPSRCHAQLHQTLSGTLVAQDVDVALVRACREAGPGSRDLSDEDVSLVALAALKSQGGDRVGLVALDEWLLDWGGRIRSCKEVVYGDSALSTGSIEPEHALTFLSTVHECCEVGTPEYESLVEFLETEDIKRLDEQRHKRFNAKTVVRKWRRFQRVKGEMRRSEKRKLAQAAASVVA